MAPSAVPRKLAVFDGLTGMNKLRKMTLAFGAVSESFLDLFTMAQLCMLYRCWLASEWDYYPDRWEARQVLEALDGIVPDWDDHARPRYSNTTRIEPLVEVDRVQR